MESEAAVRIQRKKKPRSRFAENAADLGEAAK
jgi:hypothetical protein